MLIHLFQALYIISVDNGCGALPLMNFNLFWLLMHSSYIYSISDSVVVVFSFGCRYKKTMNIERRINFTFIFVEAKRNQRSECTSKLLKKL